METDGDARPPRLERSADDDAPPSRLERSADDDAPPSRLERSADDDARPPRLERNADDDARPPRLERSASSRAERVSMFARGFTQRYLVTHDEPAPPDKGYAWLVAAVSFVVHFVVLGVAYTNGVWLTPLSAALESSLSSTSWIFGGFMLVFLLGNIAVGRLIDRFGFRLPLLLGSFVMPAGIFFASFAQQFWQSIVLFSVVAGFGGSLLFLPAATSVGAWFERRRGLGVGVAVAGSGVGNAALAPVFEALRNSIGWRASFRVIAVCMFVLLIGMSPMPKRRVKLKRAPMSFAFLRRLRPFYPHFVSLLLIGYGYYSPFVHILNHAHAVGIERHKGVFVLSALGISSTVGRVTFGAASDKLGVQLTLRLCLLIMAVSLFVLPALTSLAGLIVWAAVYGACAGSVPASVPSTCAKQFDAQSYGVVSGFSYAAFAAGNFLGPPLSAMQFEATSTYASAFYTCGVTLIVASLVNLLVTLPPPRVDSKDVEEVVVVENGEEEKVKEARNDDKGREEGAATVKEAECDAKGKGFTRRRSRRAHRRRRLQKLHFEKN